MGESKDVKALPSRYIVIPTYEGELRLHKPRFNDELFTVIETFDTMRSKAEDLKGRMALLRYAREFMVKLAIAAGNSPEDAERLISAIDPTDNTVFHSIGKLGV